MDEEYYHSGALFEDETGMLLMLVQVSFGGDVFYHLVGLDSGNRWATDPSILGVNYEISRTKIDAYFNQHRFGDVHISPRFVGYMRDYIQHIEENIGE